MDWTQLTKVFGELVFPIAVAAYLLWERTRLTERIMNTLVEVKIAMYIMLQKVDAIDDFENALRKMKESEAIKK